MALSFPNQCRSFDHSRKCVCFWGHDNVIEVSFFVNLEALQTLNPSTGDSADACLDTFDKDIELIHQVAYDIYTSTRKTTYAHTLMATDFQ